MTDDSVPDVLSLAQIQHLMRVEFSRAQRYGYPIVCLVVAVDGLGPLRDEFGYEVKEAVLDELTTLLHVQTRGSDFLGRLPDDRFMIVVPHSEPGRVQILAERLVVGAREIDLPQLGGAGLTLSVGGSWMTKGETLFFDDLLRTAQQCLAEARAAGGDRYLFREPQGAL
jgi:diguanylate cyclase (GGDEF)-like protein